jgi:molybdate transport system ATP-binding protein
VSIDARFHIQRGSFVLDVDLRIPGEGVTALFGRSGSGKTTILRCIAGLERIPGGYLGFNEQIWQDRDRFLPVHRRPLGFVFQESSLFPHMKVSRNLEFGMKRIPPHERQVGFDETVHLLGLSGLLNRYPDELSGGQRQRVSIGRALLTSPRLLLMDEPMASLDTTSKDEILPYLERLHDQLSIPVIYVSHNIEEVTRLADHMILLADGRVLAQGPLQEVLTRGDLPLAHLEVAAAVIEARVIGHDHRHHLTELDFDGGTLLIARQEIPQAARIRVRIHARDVVINLSAPSDSSVLNCLPAQVLDVSDDPRPGHVLVRLGVGSQTLLSRITRRSLERLALQPGMRVFALVKSVGIT